MITKDILVNRGPQSGHTPPSSPAHPGQTAVQDDGAETLTCASCGEAFVFGPGEQKFYAFLGFVPPRHCRHCRAERRRTSQKGPSR